MQLLLHAALYSHGKWCDGIYCYTCFKVLRVLRIFCRVVRMTWSRTVDTNTSYPSCLTNICRYTMLFFSIVVCGKRATCLEQLLYISGDTLVFSHSEWIDLIVPWCQIMWSKFLSVVDNHALVYVSTDVHRHLNGFYMEHDKVEITQMYQFVF